LLGMTIAFGVAGVAQTYLERRFKMEFMQVQNEIKVHFVVLILMATLFAIGITYYIIQFVKYGLPNDEALEAETN